MNRLANEKSPYLLQHKDNPVNWFSWGEEAFQKSRLENKPIFLSIGYSTCYWCHMMEKDSFEKEEVAAVLNKHFVPIKVDREERPDVDKIYMDAVVALTGHGGWPLSVFLTPELKPFYGGTFFWKDQFIRLLEGINDSWHQRRHEIENASQGLLEAISRNFTETLSQLPTETVFRNFEKECVDSFDHLYGGFGPAPKFPPSTKINLLLNLYRETKNEGLKSIALHTLQKMACGGIYDHVGGGFHRYATDKKWLVPHFEKMLYDNALLTETYIEAYRTTNERSFLDVAKDTLTYILEKMTSSEGGFYSAEDAGEVGKEGEFYVWKESELKEILTSEEFQVLSLAFDVSSQGNFEHETNILAFKDTASWEDKKNSTLRSTFKKLKSIRDTRKHPHLDDKILTSWNALTISSFIKAFAATDDITFKNAAIKASDFILSHLHQKGTLLRRYREGEAKFSGTSEDYSYFIKALLDLHGITADKKYLALAITFQKQLDTLFWDSESKTYFFSAPDDPSIILRQKEVTDGATPSSNGISIQNLFRLFYLTQELPYRERAIEILKTLSTYMERYPSAFSSALLGLHYDKTHPNYCVGDTCLLSIE